MDRTSRKLWHDTILRETLSAPKSWLNKSLNSSISAEFSLKEYLHEPVPQTDPENQRLFFQARILQLDQSLQCDVLFSLARSPQLDDHQSLPKNDILRKCFLSYAKHKNYLCASYLSLLGLSNCNESVEVLTSMLNCRDFANSCYPHNKIVKYYESKMSKFIRSVLLSRYQSKLTQAKSPSDLQHGTLCLKESKKTKRVVEKYDKQTTKRLRLDCTDNIPASSVVVNPKKLPNKPSTKILLAMVNSEDVQGTCNILQNWNGTTNIDAVTPPIEFITKVCQFISVDNETTVHLFLKVFVVPAIIGLKIAAPRKFIQGVKRAAKQHPKAIVWHLLIPVITIPNFINKNIISFVLNVIRGSVESVFLKPLLVAGMQKCDDCSLAEIELLVCLLQGLLDMKVSPTTESINCFCEFVCQTSLKTSKSFAFIKYVLTFLKKGSVCFTVNQLLTLERLLSLHETSLADSCLRLLNSFKQA